MPVFGQTGRVILPGSKPGSSTGSGRENLQPGKGRRNGRPARKRSRVQAGRSVAPQVVTNAIPSFEGFEDVTLLSPAGWFFQNNSSPLGTEPDFFQGVVPTPEDMEVFPAQSGPPASYIAVDFNSVDGENTISNWMLTPNGPLHNGDVVSFWTRRIDIDEFPDRLQVRLSTNGASTNVGATATEVGDFTTLLLDINPNYTTTDYPRAWTKFSITLGGLPPEGTSGRIGFRYFVEDSGPLGINGTFVGIDTFSFTPAGSQPVNDQVSFVVANQGLTPISGGCATAGYTNRFHINVALRNIGPNTLSLPYFTVLELQAANGTPPVNPYRLRTADDFNDSTCTGGLIGTTQAVSGPIAPNQIIPVDFDIEMPRMGRYRFVVSMNAVTGTGGGSARLGRLAIEGRGFDASKKPVLAATFIPEPGTRERLSVNAIQATAAK